MDNDVTLIGLAQRVSVLETQQTSNATALKDIGDKLDQLLDLKSKGMGAIGLVSILIGSGALGLLALAFNLFANRPHL